MLSFLRSTTPRSTTYTDNPIVFEDGRSSIRFHSTADSHYAMTHTLPPAHTPTFLAPPLHIHLFQQESFRVVSGTGAFYLHPAKNPHPSLLSKDATTDIPPGAPHRFENASREEQLVVDVRLDPSNPQADESFFRNFFGYLEDCRKTNSSPSVFQLFVFLKTVDGPLAVPMPGWMPEAVGRWSSRGIMVALAGVGKWVLGYKGSYQEYYQQSAV